MGELFEKIKVSSLQYKTSELPSEAIGEFTLPALTAGIQNQGLNNYVPRKNATILKNVISISANGANTGVTFYQSGEFTVLQDAYAIKWIYSPEKLKDEHFLFFVGAIRKTIYGNYEWTNKAGWERIKHDKIQLPTKNGQIDFAFMESFVAELEAQRIAELEAQRIAELEAYLLATGLKDYELTPEEQNALGEGGYCDWREFRIGDLFDKVDLKIRNPNFNKKTDLSDCYDEHHTIPVTNAKFGDNGIMFWAKEGDFDTTEMSVDIVQNGAVATGKVYPQPQATGVLWDSYLIKATNMTLTRELLFFMSSAIEKAIRQKYSYEYKAYWAKVQDDMIFLPTRNGQIDFNFMETFISALQKLIIKDVVLYADEKLEATKQAVSR